MFYIKQNDTAPALQVTLTRPDGTAANVTGATVDFHMRLPGATTSKVDAAGELVTPASGIVKYVWAAGDTDTPGLYHAEFQITYADGSIETFPNGGPKLRVNITPELD